MNNKLPGTIATSQSDFETFTHPKTNMTTMRERFDDTFYEEVNSFMGTSFGDSKLDAKLKEFIEQELKKEREEIVDWIEKQDWECVEQEIIKEDIINTIKNRT